METTGRTVEEAKDAALDQLGVDETEAEFVIVSEPRAGLFGRMRGEARVRARVVPTAPRPKRGRSRRAGPERRNEGRPSRSTTSAGSRSGSGRGTAGSAATLEDDDDVSGSSDGEGT
ncbi:MAG: Jag N-terminal domain-containing protein, partial [Gemmatimonadales bacterium]